MIKMISGVYGLPVKQPDGRIKVERKGPNDGPFSLAPEKEQRLVDRGVAVYVQPEVVVEQPQDNPVDDGKLEQEQVGDIAPIGFDESPPDPDDLPEAVTGIPAYSVDMKPAELREIGAMCGLTFRVGMSKADMVAQLDAYIAAHMVEGVEVDEDGEITVDDGEPEPTFDASEAVQ